MKKNQRIRTALKERGLTQLDLAELLGVSSSKVTDMMRRELPADAQDEIVQTIEGAEKTLKNQRVRKALEKKKVYLWELADALGCAVVTVYRRMHSELPKVEQDKLIALIDEISEKEDR